MYSVFSYPSLSLPHATTGLTILLIYFAVGICDKRSLCFLWRRNLHFYISWRRTSGLSPRRPGFYTGPFGMRFVVDKVALGHFILRVLLLSPVSIIPPLLYSSASWYHCYFKVERAKLLFGMLGRFGR